MKVALLISTHLTALPRWPEEIDIPSTLKRKRPEAKKNVIGASNTISDAMHYQWDLAGDKNDGGPPTTVPDDIYRCKVFHKRNLRLPHEYSIISPSPNKLHNKDGTKITNVRPQIGSQERQQLYLC